MKKKHVQFPDEIICGKDADLNRNEEIVFDGIIIRIFFLLNSSYLSFSIFFLKDYTSSHIHNSEYPPEE